MRWAALVLAVALPISEAAAAQDGAACSRPISAAAYDAPTRRYPHGVLGDDVEWGALAVACGGVRATVALPEELVFEDLAPRLADLDGDGGPEIVTVESHRLQGARLSVWGLRDGALVRIAATPFIGQRFRWLAPVGAADLDGDGMVEIAYVDRPHLARTLRVWRYADGTLTEIASLPGVTNHRIGEDFISGGVRDCGGEPEIVLADAGWRRIVAVTLKDGRLHSRDLGALGGVEDIEAALSPSRC